jgi:S1-C subfamily serine protease
LLTLALFAIFTALALQVLDTRRPARPAPTAASPLAPVPSAAEPAARTNGPGLLPEESNVISIYRRVSPSVVSVANKALVRAGLFGFQIYEVPQGSGSGLVWDREGHILSNYHVVHQASAVTVTFPDGASYDAQIVGVDPDHDLAVLRIDAGGRALQPVAVGSSRALQVGQSVLAIGNPFGLDTTLTVGIVSALGRTITSMTERRIQDVIQTDAAINPGNSGGPLLDSCGRLIGLNTAILSPSGAYAGIGFAVPADTVMRVVPQLISRGRVSRAGIGVQLLPDHVTRRTGVTGAALLSVLPGSPAAEAGLEGVTRNRSGDLLLGDVIVGVDRHTVGDLEDLRAAFDRYQPGEAVELSVRRAGRVLKKPVRLREVE